ncbi:hypothetical protein D3C71_763700 [compost metagenome]
MKRALLSLSIISFCFLSNAQRSVDLELIITSHADGDYFFTEVPVDFSTEILNLGSETLEATDSVFYYMLFYGDTLPIGHLGANHELYTGATYLESQSFQTLHNIGFSYHMNGITTNLCVYAKVVNATNPISDPVLANNSTCVSLIFIDEAELSVGENDLSTVKLTPNPASNSFSITGVDSNVSIADLNGKTIDFEWNLAGEIDCSSWLNGVYLVNISNADGAFVKRLVVSH